jgi:hypothetical protein
VLALAVAALGVGLTVVSVVAIADAWRPLVQRQPPAVETFGATGFPNAWVTVVAADGSFRVTVPGPGTMSLENGVWALDLHDWSEASCVLYLDWAGPQADPREYTRRRLDAWVAKMSDPHEAPTAVRAGSAIGWRTRMSYEDGDYPVGQFEVVYAEGWEYSMGCGLGFTHPRSAERLTERFLDSFRTIRSDQRPTRLDVATQP